ncbi:hypothetical protein DET49_12070 [Salegentibacter sp. 24]|uniref:MBG domain-containing protein n=1 Tax=Salegentibacter sp. 24 TaxID=2183986 RepID=UPI00105E962C|nr:MBG domain-containing protein [Salegentibacter sp. 24]TDN83870.1 hypothetical protein DET49_12070 [Salegentibacter sp. 24]
MKKKLLLIFLFFTFFLQTAFAQITTVDFNGLSENQYLAQSYSTGGFTFSINLANGAGIVTRSGSGFQGSISLYDTNTNIGALTRWTIKKNDGSEFQFRSIFLQDAGFASPSGTIQGFKNGSAVGPAKSINFNSGTAGLKDFAGDPDFYDVDEIRIQAVDINFHLDHFTYGPVFVDETEIPAEITSISLTGAPLSNVSSITFAVNFSKAALNVSSDDFDLNRTGTANGSIGSVSGSGSSYTVTVNNIIGEGSLRLDLKEGTNITNSNGNNGTAGFTSGQTHYVSPCLIETLEDETNGSKAFSIGSNNFSITGNMEVRTETPTIGIDGSRYTLINTGTGNYTISSNNGVVLLNSMAIYLSSLADGTNPTGNGTLTLVGKQGGSTVYTITKNSGFETDGTTNSGYTILDFSTEGGVDNSIIPVDQLEISIGGAFQYLNVDNFGFCTDDEAPNAYSVNIDQDPIADATENDVSFTFTDAELNATYNYTFTSSGGGTPISGSGTISSVNQQVTGIDLGSLNVGTVTLSVTLTDLSGNVGNPATDNKSKVSNSPPVATPPAAPVVQEDDVDVPISDAFAVADVDGDDQTVSFTVTGGTISLGTTGITFNGDGNGSTSFTASGSLANINAALTAATFTPNPDLNGTNGGTISFFSNDAEVDSNVASVSFDIEAINDDPKLTGLPNSIAVEEDASDNPFDISSATISDVDAGSGEVTLKLSATGGIFDIAAGTGITLSGHLTGELTLTGNLTNLTNYISQPTNINFRPDANLTGDASASVEVRINDNGNIGLGGGNDILIATIEIDIIPVNDLPTAINFTVNPLEGQVYIFSAANFGYKDLDGEPLVDLKIESIPAEGILYVDADGDNSYDEAEEVSVSERIPKNVLDTGNLQYIQHGTINTSFQFEVSDGTLSSGEDYLAKLEILALPRVTSVIVPANDRYVEGKNLDFTVNFSSDVVVNTADGMPELSLTVGASARAAVYLSGSGSSSLVFRYTVQNGEEDQDGITIGNLTTNDGTMESPDGTAADLNLSNMGTTSGVLVDAVIPVVSSVNTPSDGTFKGGQNLDFTVNFAEVVNVKTDTGIPSIVLIIGEENVSADYMSGSGSSAIVFRYTIAPGDLDLDGIQVGALATNGGSIQDAAGNNANLLLNSIGTTNGILVDATAPAVASVSTPVNGTYTSGQNLDFTINFNEKVTINTTGGAPQLAITIGSQTRQAGYLSGSGTSAIVFRYTIQNGDLDTDGISLGKLNSNGSTIVDDSGNDAILTLNAVGSTAFLFVDAIEPTGYSVNIDQDIINGVNDEEVSFTLSGAELGTTFNYSFSSEAGSTIISGSGTVSLSNQRISGIDLSSLPDGEITLELTLKDAAGNVGSNASDIVTKDLSARLSITALNQAEEDDIDGGFEVTTDNLFASNTTVNIAITGTATQGTDYGNIGTSFIFPANTKSVRIPLDVLNDLDVEGNETVIISLVETDNLQVSIGTSEKAMITITDNDVPSELVITPTLNQSKVYGESDPVFTYTATGFNLGDDESIISGKLTRITGETVGTYALKKGSLDAGANYFISIVPVNFTITPATLKVSADADDQKIYGENDPTLTYTAIGFKNGDNENILTGELSRMPGENVGTYPISLGTLNAGTNYTITYIGSDFEIKQRELAVMANPNQSKIFGDADPTFTYQVSNFGNGDDESILTGALSRLSGETVGSYPINLGDLSAGVNYKIDYTGSDFTISEKTLTITVTEDQNKVYGEADPVLTYTATGFENGDDQSILSGDLLREAGENVGTYPINLGTLSAGDNYTISFIGTGFQIKPATLTLSASAGQNKVYGMEDPKLSYTASGFQFSEGPSILTGELQRQAGENVGTYAINQGSLSAGDNYIIDYLGADFEINPATLTVTASAGQNKVYGEEDPNLSYTVSGFRFTQGPSILSGELEREAGENVGTYPINLGSLVATDNYIIDYFGADFEITARTLRVIADQDQSKVYGATDPTFTYQVSNFGNGDDESILTGALSRRSGETVGSYPINLGDLSAGVNYNIDYKGSDFTISEKTLTITVTEDQNKVYGEGDPVLTYTATGLDNGDDVSILTGELQRALGENVGTYPINLGTLGAGDNYTINFEVADFTITPASLNVTPEINQSKIYGEADGVISYTATGFERGDNETILSGALTRTAGENVGSYMITQGTLDAGVNYRLNYSGTDFTITPRSLTVIADSNQAKMYGENDPVLTYSATNFGNGDDESILSGSLSRQEGEHVGKYSITLGTLDAGRNYIIDYKGTEFSILKKTLSITVDDNQSKVYGDADPVFSYTVSGFENGDSLPVLSGTLDREPGEDIGTYAIGKGSLKAGNNYSISFNSSDFEITKASLQIIANVGQSKIYGESDPLFTYIATGFKRGDDQNVLTGILSRAEGENVGTYAIQLGSLNATKNYMIDFEGTTFEIKPATIDGIIFEDANFIYDGTPKSLEIQGEIPSGTKVLYTNNERVNVGRQEVTTTITGPNYIPLILTADITITPASITEVTFGDATYTYDGSQHSIFVDHLPEEAQVTYVNNGQTQAGIHKVIAKISQENYNDLELAANLIIEKAQALITTDAQQSFTYDGELKLVKAQLNHSETELIYSPQQGYSEAGTFDVTVSSKETNNYLAASKEVTLSIEYSEIEGVVFENESFIYDGSTKSITVSGLPQGASVSYDNNGKTNAGNYTVVATISSANSLDKVLSAQLVITKAPQEIRFDALENRYQRDGYFQLDALSSSGLPVVYSYSYESEDPAATVGSRGFVRILSPGTITITAKQQGNQNYEAADPVVRTLTIIGNEAKLNRVSINGRMYSNPQEEIYYLIDCEDNVSQIQIQFEPNQGATLDQEANLTMTISSPGIYQKTVTVTSEDGTSTKTYTIIIEKNFNFRDIVIQKFNNVLLVNNNSETNGGYSFVSYRWYRNGSVVGNGQYYSVGDDINDALDPESNYYVVVETEEGEVLRTCVSNVQLRSSFQVTLAPNPVRSGGTMELFVDFPKEELETMEISIHNLNGVLLKTLKSKSEFTNISLPNNLQIGIYLLRIDTQNIHKTLKFIVK